MYRLYDVRDQHRVRHGLFLSEREAGELIMDNDRYMRENPGCDEIDLQVNEIEVNEFWIADGHVYDDPCTMYHDVETERDYPVAHMTSANQTFRDSGRAYSDEAFGAWFPEKVLPADPDEDHPDVIRLMV